MLADIDAAAATEAAVELGDSAAAIACEVTDEEQVQAAIAATVDAFGGIEIVVNNAGIEIVSPLVMHDAESFRRLSTST